MFPKIIMPLCRVHAAIFLLALLLIKPSFLVAEEEKPGFMWGLVGQHIPFESYKLTPADIQMMADNGIEWVSLNFAWLDIEPEKDGAFDFDYYDMVVEEAQRNGLKIFAQIGNGYNYTRPSVPEWTVTLSTRNYVKQLRQYSEATVQRYADAVDYWALENEINIAKPHLLLLWRIGYWPHYKNDRIMIALSETVRKYDPSAKIVLSTAPIPPFYGNWIKHISEVIEYDVVGIHLYPFYDPENSSLKENFFGHVESAIGTASKTSGGRPVVLMESGFRTRGRDSAHYNEENQVGFVRMISEASLLHGAAGLFIYQFLDSPEERGEKERSFGLVRQDRSPKPAWSAYGEIIETYYAQ